jgi:hypothetical protein
MVLGMTSVVIAKPCTISSFFTKELSNVTKQITNKPLPYTPILYLWQIFSLSPCPD